MQFADRIGRLNDWGTNNKIDLFLLSSPAALPYYSGYYFYFEHGPSPFQILPAIFITGKLFPSTLLLADNEVFTSPQGSPVQIHQYSTYTYLKPLDYSKHFLSELISLIALNSLGKISIGIEKNHIPHLVIETLTSLHTSIQFIDVAAFINHARMVKDADEIYLIRKAAALCDAGQQALFDHASDAETELDLFARIRNTMDKMAGTRVPLMADLVSGKRTASGGGIPSSKKMVEGELVLGDFTPCLNGYWGDCCNTVAVGEPLLKQRNDFRRIKDGLSRVIDRVKPGIKACEIDQLLRSTVSDYPHHSGHGVGTMSHEEPRITPYNQTPLEQGMVIALEPAIYRDEYGLRLEHLLLVNNDGAEILTKFDHIFCH